MSSPLQAAISDALATVASAEGRAVTLSRGASSASVTAVSWWQDWTLEDGEGFPIVVRLRVFRIAAADYAPAGSAVTPARGDRMVEVIAGAQETFEVMPDPGIPAFGPASEANGYWNINTKQVA